MHEKTVVLDTCAFLWLAQGSDALSARAIDAIEGAALALVSAISAWEIGLKVACKQLVLPLEPREWFVKAARRHRLTVAPLEIEVLISANALPWHHRDPADRFIITTAQLHHAAVVTADKRFRLYDVPVIS